MNSPSRLNRILYGNFSRYYRFKRWYLRKFTGAGIYAQVALAFSALVGMNTQLSVAYKIFGIVFALCLATLGMAVAMGLRRGPRLRIVRMFPRYATVGEEVVYRLRITNVSPHKVHGLSLMESHYDARPGLEEFTNTREPGWNRLNRYDRQVGYYRWEWLIERNEVAQIEEIFVPALEAGEMVEVEGRFVPKFRGELNLTGLTIGRREVLGLCRGTWEYALAGGILVLPKTYQMPALNLPGQLHYQPAHRLAAASLGNGDEVVGLRDYRPGDALRDIHWKSFARTGKPCVREYQMECFERHALLLDTDPGTSDEGFEEAVSLAASFVGSFDGGESLLDLLFVGSQCHSMTMGPGALDAEALIRVLALVKPSLESGLEALKATVLSRRMELSSCVCILVSWDEGRQRLVRELQETGLPLLVLVVDERAPEECPPWLHHIAPGRVEEGLARL